MSFSSERKLHALFFFSFYLWIRKFQYLDLIGVFFFFFNFPCWNWLRVCVVLLSKTEPKKERTDGDSTESSETPPVAESKKEDLELNSLPILTSPKAKRRKIERNFFIFITLLYDKFLSHEKSWVYAHLGGCNKIILVIFP